DGGSEPRRILVGAGHCALTDTVRLTAEAVRLGCGGVLMLPPFYYKDVTDGGLFRSIAEVIDRVRDTRLRVYRYHIPQGAHIAVSAGLIERLLKTYPDIIAGMKDSSGDWSHTRAMLERFRGAGFEIFSGSERFLLDVLRGGGAGCISATVNVNPAAIAQ